MTIRRHRDCSARYINKSVIDRWEQHGDTIVEGATRSAIEPLNLQRFIGHKSDGSQFQECLSTPLDKITDHHS